MKKTILTGIFALLIVMLVGAQDYNTGIGLRGGLSQGLTIKHFVGDNTALEGIISTRWGGFNLTGLYEIHAQAFDTPGLNWYYGIGGHVGFWDGNQNKSWFDDNNNYTVIGIDGIIGIEYNFSEIPINLSLDWKPAFNLSGHSGFWGDNGAVSIRYIF